MHINLIPDDSVSSAPAGFVAQVQAAAYVLDQTFTDNITVNIRYGWGTYDNKPDSNLMAGGKAAIDAVGGPDPNGDQIAVDYATLKSWLTPTADSSAYDVSAFAHLPSNNSAFPNGANTFDVFSAQAMALGHLSYSSSRIDGAIAFGVSSTNANDFWFVSTLHEIAHALGRTTAYYNYMGAPSIMDLYRYSSPGHFQWTGGQPAYFSIDGGTTDLANFGTHSDYGDFDDGTNGGNDPFNEAGIGTTLTKVDLELMDVLGFHRPPVTVDPWQNPVPLAIGPGVSNLDVAKLSNGSSVASWAQGGAVDFKILPAPSASASSPSPTITVGSGNGATNAEIAPLTNGNFVVDWYTPGGGGEVDAQIYDPNGNPVGQKIVVAPAGITTNIETSSIAPLDNGGFVVNYSTAHFARIPLPRWTLQETVAIYNSSGVLQSSLAEISGRTSISEASISVRTLDLGNGQFVEIRPDQSGDYHTFIESDTSPSGAGFLSPVIDPGSSSYALTKLQNGNFVAVWNTPDPTTHAFQVKYQIFDQSAAPVTGILKPTESSGVAAFNPDIAAVGNDFVITWTQASGSGFVVEAQVFAPDGTPVTPTAFNVNASDVGNDFSSSISALPGNKFVITYDNHPDPASSTLFLKSQAFVIGNGASTSLAPMSVTAPAVAHDDAFVTSETSATKSNLFADNGSGADQSADGSAFSVTAVNGDATAVGSQVTLASGAILTVNADGSFNYDPNHAFDSLPAPGSGASNSYAMDAFTYTITGGATATALVTINGADSDDVLLGTPGADTLNGGIGADSMSGGPGDDTYYVDNSGDVVIENPNEGVDTVYSSIDYVLPANVENLVLTGSVDRHGTGNGLDNVITGNGGNDTLSGLGGNDTLDGGAGTNTAVYSGQIANYHIVHNVDGSWTITDLRPGSPDGIDTLVNIQFVQFSDATYALHDVSRPTITGYAPGSGVAGDGVTNATSITLTGTAEADSKMKVYDGAALLGSVTAGANGAWSFITSGTLANGSHSFAATATDIAGNTSAPSSALALTVDAIAPLAPTITGYSPDSGVAGDGITNANSITLTGAAEANSTVRVYDSTTPLGSVTTDATGAWSFTTTGTLADGSHSFTATAADVAGNASAASSVLALTVDTTAPATPVVDTDLFNSDGSITLTGMAEANSTVRIYDGGILLGAVTADASGAWSEKTAPLTNGAHTFTATDTDAAGNTGAVSTILAFTKTIGTAGNDTLIGLAGNDLLDGGAGADTMIGGTGNDIYVVDNAGDTVIEHASEGIDTVETSLAAYTLPANVENLIGTSNAGQTLTGNSLANAISGGTGNDVIDGGPGIDTMTGGLGNDTYYVDNEADTIIEHLNEGTDTVYSAVNYTLPANLEVLHLVEGAPAAINGAGNDALNWIYGNSLDNALSGGLGDDILLGGAGNDILDGGPGNDVMVGGAGDDTYYVDSEADTIVENPNEGTDTVFASINYTLSANFEKLFLVEGAPGAINGAGNDVQNFIYGNSLSNALSGYAGDDVLVGGAGNDILDGGTGNDTMAGGTGDDTYYVDSEADTIIENPNEGTDTVFTSMNYTLPSNFEILFLQEGAPGAINGAGNSSDNRIYGNSLDNALSGGAGNDILVGGAGNDILDGGPGADILAGGTGRDTFVFHAGEGNGDAVIDFSGAGGDGDMLRFMGYGTAAQGANLTQLDATHWSINAANGLVHDVIQLSNAASVHAGDCLFV